MMEVLAALMLVLVTAGTAHAHDDSPGVLSLVERDDGRFDVVFSAPNDTRALGGADVAPRYPAHCALSDGVLDCEGELSGDIEIVGLRGTRLTTVVVITRRDADPEEHVATGDAPIITLGAPPAGIVAWAAIGAEHVLLGLDHLAFVLGLLLVCGLDRRVVATLTAFTVAHSLTLALAVLDVVRLPSAPVEACIALSIVLVAREALARSATPSLTERAPWVVAGIFGLVHGLGFAGALMDLGLPRRSLGTALLGFNVGVELGQLMVALAAALVAWGAVRLGAERARPVVAYGLGALGAFWLIARVAAMAG